ncbi:hypothetical protein [Methylobacter marinus]|jgi:predicted Co/Zn/Cd cation transporter (cation efflux family)|uniref:hypothetical protein n=1 Tax=Methylobacter marinus TaxID=34058 RepID=UPI00036AC38D|nr:hypothetical protein [Methylobacter marinus]
MESSHQPSTLSRFFSFFVFSLLTISILTQFGWGVFQLYARIAENGPVIVFDKGVFYLLGAGVTLGALTLGGLYQGILRLPLTKKVTKILTNVLIGGVVVMFVLPHIVHYPVESYLEGRGYNICEQASYRWFTYRKIVYVSNSEACAELIKRKNNRITGGV